MPELGRASQGRHASPFDAATGAAKLARPRVDASRLPVRGPYGYGRAVAPREVGVEVVPERVVDADEQRLLAGLRAREEWAFMELVERYGASLLRVALALRGDARGGRGGRAGDVARRARRDRPLRGPLVAQDLALPDPHEPGQDAGGARGAEHPVLVARRRGGRRRTSRRSTPTASCPPTTRAGRATGPRRRARGRELPDQRLLGAETRQVISDAIDALPHGAAHGDLAARRRGLAERGGRRGARPQRGQPARPAPPGARARCALRSRPTWTRPRPRPPRTRRRKARASRLGRTGLVPDTWAGPSAA